MLSADISSLTVNRNSSSCRTPFFVALCLPPIFPNLIHTNVVQYHSLTKEIAPPPKANWSRDEHLTYARSRTVLRFDSGILRKDSLFPQEGKIRGIKFPVAVL